MKTYDPKKFDIVYAGIHLNEGVADGTFVVYSSTTPAFSSKAGTDGEVTRSRQHDRRSTVRLTLMQTSEVNDRLSTALAADMAAQNGLGVGSFLIRDRSGTTLIEASRAWIMDDPDLNLEQTASTREWVFELADTSAFHGSNPDD